MSGPRALIKAVLCGGFAAGAPALLFSVPFGLALIADGSFFDGLYVLCLPLIMAGLIVLTASLLIGLPLTAMLAALGKERGEYYLVAGFLFGSAPFVFWMLMPFDRGSLGLLAFLGGLGGAVTGWHWGRHRDAVIAARGSAD